MWDYLPERQLSNKLCVEIIEAEGNVVGGVNESCVG